MEAGRDPVTRRLCGGHTPVPSASRASATLRPRQRGARDRPHRTGRVPPRSPGLVRRAMARDGPALGNHRRLAAQPDAAGRPAGPGLALRAGNPRRAANRSRSSGRCAACRWPADSQDVVSSSIAGPATRLVTLTVTEKGYCLDGGGRLDLQHADIRHDLDHPESPRSAIGFLVEGLRLRRARQLPAVPVLSCDNLAGNGRLLAAAARDFAAQLDPGLAAWIEAEVAFPCTMVDSITPATHARTRAAGHQRNWGWKTAGRCSGSRSCSGSSRSTTRSRARTGQVSA